MFRTLTLEPMRQEQGQLAQALPLQVATGDELVDNHLGAIGKVTELRLPDHQGIGAGCGIAVFKAKHRQLREQRIDHLETWLPGREMRQWNMTSV